MDNLDIELRKHKFIQLVQDHFNPLDVSRSLWQVDIKPIVILYGEHPCMLNNSIYPSVVHCVKSLEEGYKLLVEQYGNEEYKPFVFCSDDTTESFLDVHYDELKDHFIFYNAGEQGRVTFLQNKKTITSLGVEAGMTIPKSEVVDTGVLPKTLKYPIITKVLASTMGAWKDDVYICHNEEELKDAYKKIKSPKLILQEYIYKKGEFCMEGFSCNDGNDVFIPYICNYIRIYDNSYGHYMEFTPFKNEALKEKILKLFKLTKFNGIFEIEFMRGPNDENYFLEINFRASTWNYALTVGGGNLPYFWAKSMLSGKIHYEEMELTEKPFRAMVEPDDFIMKVLKAREVGLIQWIKELKSCECTYYYDKNDPKPLRSYIANRIINYFRKRMKL